jgi:hypothetical protein
MNLTYPERLALIDLTKVRLGKMRLYVTPAPPCNDNQSLDNLDEDADYCNPCLQLVDKVGASWQIRRASLSEIANRSQRTYQDWK